jgi:hypothetical protein
MMFFLRFIFSFILSLATIYLFMNLEYKLTYWQTVLISVVCSSFIGVCLV